MAEQMNPQDQKIDPQTQEQFDIFVANGMSIIHDPKVTDDILNRILQSGEPVKTIAEVTVDIITRLTDSAAKNNISLANETLIHGSNILMGEIINIAEQAGMQKLTDEQKTQSYQLASSIYIDQAVKSGKLSEEQLVELGKTIPQEQAQPKQDQVSTKQNNSGLLKTQQGGI